MGGQGVTPEKVAAVANDLPLRPEFHLVANSTHLSFGMPCSPAIAKVAGVLAQFEAHWPPGSPISAAILDVGTIFVPPYCVDPPGFNRAVFKQQFNAQVLAFFRQKLTQ